MGVLLGKNTILWLRFFPREVRQSYLVVRGDHRQRRWQSSALPKKHRAFVEWSRCPTNSLLDAACRSGPGPKQSDGVKGGPGASMGARVPDHELAIAQQQRRSISVAERSPDRRACLGRVEPAGGSVRLAPKGNVSYVLHVAPSYQATREKATQSRGDIGARQRQQKRTSRFYLLGTESRPHKKGLRHRTSGSDGPPERRQSEPLVLRHLRAQSRARATNRRLAPCHPQFARDVAFSVEYLLRDALA